MWLSLFLCVNNFSLMNHPIPCERGLVLGFGPNKILHSRSIFFEDENEHSTARTHASSETENERRHQVGIKGGMAACSPHYFSMSISSIGPFN